MLIDGVEGQDRRLGLMIDLTKTDRFYDPSELGDVQYVKIRCAGYGSVPAPDQDQTPIYRNPDSPGNTPDYYNFPSPPGIYKPDYIDELIKMYGDGSEMISAPELPDWCTECDDGDDEEPNRKRRKTDGSSGGPGHGKFMEGVSDTIKPVPDNILKEIQHKCCQLSGRKGLGFVGSQPVSMDMKNIELLRQMPYNVSWKADGFRYLMLILAEGQIFMIDRDNNAFRIPVVRFLFSRDLHAHVEDSSKPLTHLTDTLVDGEMVIDKDGNNSIPRYLIYDVISLNGKYVGDQNHEMRMKIVLKELVEPRRYAISKNIIDRQAEPFGIREKTFWFLNKNSLRELHEKFLPKLSHENDGIILSPIMKPYTPGTTPELLKWKPGNLNSVDFLLHVEENKPRPGELRERVGKLFVGGLDHPYAQIKATKKIRELHRRIVECVWKGGTWEVIRVREDKSFPNSYQTAHAVVESIKHPITLDGLYQFVDRFGWKPPNRQQQQPANPPAELKGDQKLMPPPPVMPTLKKKC
eukprot:sb/3463852/